MALEWKDRRDGDIIHAEDVNSLAHEIQSMGEYSQFVNEELKQFLIVQTELNTLRKKIETTRAELFGDTQVSHKINFDIAWQYAEYYPETTFSNLADKSFTVNLSDIFGDCYMDLDDSPVFDNTHSWEADGWNADFKITVGDIQEAYLIFCVDVVSKEIWIETTAKKYTTYNGTYSNGIWIFPIGDMLVDYTQSDDKYTANVDWIFYYNIGNGASGGNTSLYIVETALAPNNLNNLNTEAKASFFDAINENTAKIKNLSPVTIDANLSDTSENPVQNKVIKAALDNIELSGGNGIVSVEQTTTSNADGGTNIVTVTMSDGSVSTFTVKNGSKGSTGATGAKGAIGNTGAKGDTGTRGSQWYSGTALTGTATGTNYSYSGASDALVGDYYINTSTGGLYRCVVAGSGTTAKWQYQGSIKGATGEKGETGSYAAVDTALSSASTNPVQNKVVTASLNNKKSIYSGSLYIPSYDAPVGTVTVYEGAGIGRTTMKQSSGVRFGGTGTIIFRNMTVILKAETGISSTASLIFENCRVCDASAANDGTSFGMYRGSGNLTFINSITEIAALEEVYGCYSGIKQAGRVSFIGGEIKMKSGSGNYVSGFDCNLIYDCDEYSFTGVKITCEGVNNINLVYSGRGSFNGGSIILANDKHSICHYDSDTTAGASFTGVYVEYYAAYMKFASISGCTFKHKATGSASANQMVLQCPTCMTGNHFIGSAAYINGQSMKHIIDRNLSDNGITVGSAASGSVTTNNITY